VSKYLEAAAKALESASEFANLNGEHYAQKSRQFISIADSFARLAEIEQRASSPAYIVVMQNQPGPGA
jgi:hypothetical protein